MEKEELTVTPRGTSSVEPVSRVFGIANFFSDMHTDNYILLHDSKVLLLSLVLCFLEKPALLDFIFQVMPSFNFLLQAQLLQVV